MNFALYYARITTEISNVEETTLVRWIVRLARTGYPMSPTLVIEIAENIRRARVQLSRTASLSPFDL